MANEKLREKIIKVLNAWEDADLAGNSKGFISNFSYDGLALEILALVDKPVLHEPRPPDCVCCEHMNHCEADRENGQKIDYCPDTNYIKWLGKPPAPVLSDEKLKEVTLPFHAIISSFDIRDSERVTAQTQRYSDLKYYTGG